jgi:hypothetical protein
MKPFSSARALIQSAARRRFPVAAARLLCAAFLSCAAARAADPRVQDWFYNPFSKDSAHHRPIGTGARYADISHPAVEDFLTGSALNINVGSGPWGCGVWEARPDDPTFTVKFGGRDGAAEPPGFPITCRLPLAMTMRQGRSERGGFDGVLVVYDRAADVIHHFRQFSWNTDKPTADAKPTAGAHRTWSIRGPAHADALGERTGTSASGVAAMFGILRGWEVKAAGHPIGHALQLVVPRNAPVGTTRIMLSRDVWWPAVGMDGSAYSNPKHNTGHLPYGSLWALPPVEKGGPDLATLGLSEKGRRLAECIRDYGLYVVDGGGATALRADQDFEPELLRELKAETAKFYRYIRLVENSVPDAGKVGFQVGDGPTKPTGNANHQIIRGEFPAGGGTPLAPNTAIDAARK